MSDALDPRYITIASKIKAGGIGGRPGTWSAKKAVMASAAFDKLPAPSPRGELARYAQKSLERYESLKAEEVSVENEGAYNAFTALINMSGAKMISQAPKNKLVRHAARLRGTPKRHWKKIDYQCAKRVVGLIQKAATPAQKTLYGHDPYLEIQKKLEAEQRKIVASVTGIELEKGFSIRETMYQKFGEEVAKGIDYDNPALAEWKRLLLINISVEDMDLQRQIIRLEALQKSWPLFCREGTVDLNHLAAVTRPEDRAKQMIEAAGVPYHATVGKMALEVGRGIPGTFVIDKSGNKPSAWVICGIYSNGNPHPDQEELKSTIAETAHDYLWRTFSYSPPMIWKASVGGHANAPVPALVTTMDEFGRGEMDVIAQLIEDFSFTNLALTPTPVNHHVVPVKVLRGIAA